MAILIDKVLPIPQYIKLFSNPVSGIACEIHKDYSKHVYPYIKDIRYSKSMILRALDFWFDQYHKYYMKVWSIRTAFIDVSGEVLGILKGIGQMINDIKNMPDSFLFSHRHIKEIDVNKYRGNNRLSEQNALLNKKYDMKFIHQEGTLNQFRIMKLKNNEIWFTVFPNEHPYITKDKISRVGVTEAGNVYVLHRKKKNGAYNPKPIKKQPQAPEKFPHLTPSKFTNFAELGDIKLGDIIRQSVETLVERISDNEILFWEGSRRIKRRW